MNKIINYGLVKPIKKCEYCDRPNHKDNTNCWYCKKELNLISEEKQ